MRIGSFWGMPAPMVLLAFEDDTIMQLLDTLNTVLNQQILRDVRAEFAVLCSIEKIVRPVLDKPDFLQVSNSYETVLRVEQGKLVFASSTQGTEGLNLATLQQDWMSELTIDLAQKIVDTESRGSGIALTSASSDELHGVIQSALAGKSFPLSDTASFILEIVRARRTDHSSLTQQILREFSHSMRIPNSVIVDGEKVLVSDEMRKVMMWYAERLPRIQRIAASINSETMHEEMVFGIPFFDLLKRKPESLIYMVMNKFDYVKNKQTAHGMEIVCADVRDNLDRYRICIDKYTVRRDEKVDLALLDKEAFERYCESLPEDEHKFMKQCVDSSIFSIDDSTLNDAKVLVDLYRGVRKLNYAYFNEVFGLNCTPRQWDVLVRNLCKTCICGLNNYSSELFSEALRNISLAADTKIGKPDEFFEKIERIESDVESLLSTIRPIGEVLA